MQKIHRACRVSMLEGGSVLQVKGGMLLHNGIPQDEPCILEKPADTLQKLTVPEGCLCAMGDNRNNSYDSHVWGPASRKCSFAGVI
jgi:signal peptidase I